MRRLLPLLKVAIAVALIGVMVKRQILDFTWLRNVHEHAAAGLVLFIILYVQVFLSSIRWRLLLRAQGAAISIGAAVRLTLTGCAFSTIIPGTISGDLVKLYYLKPFRIDSGRAIAALVVDRICGLLGLIMLGTGPAVFVLLARPGGTAITAWCRAIVCAAIGVVLVVGGVLHFGGRIQQVLEQKQFRYGAAAARIVGSIADFRNNRGSLAAALGISGLVHMLTCVAVIWAGGAIVGKDLPVVTSILLLPVVLVAMAIPITPAGVGVGQAAAFALFELAHRGSGTAAANAFTVFQTTLVLAYSTGLIPYVMHRNTASPPVESEQPAQVLIREEQRENAG